MQMKPIQYHLEAYLGSRVNDPFAFFTSSTPFPAFAPGQWIGSGDFGNPTEERPEAYRVVSLGHIMWEVESHIGHKLMLVVEADRELSDSGEWVNGLPRRS